MSDYNGYNTPDGTNGENNQYQQNQQNQYQQRGYQQEGTQQGYQQSYQQQNYQPYGNQAQYGPNEPQQPKQKKKGKGFAGVIAAMLAVGVVAGSLLTGFIVVPMAMKNQQPASQVEVLPNDSAKDKAQGQAEAPAGTDDPAVEKLPELGGETAQIEDVVNPVPEIAESAQESVVGVAAYQKALESGQEPIEMAVSSGTGFVISDEGYILTNNHVIEGGNLVKVTDYQGNEYTATVVGTDSPTEIAVLKVEGLKLKPIAIGNSDNVKTGELVVAIGNPLGQQLSNTVTVGYVSAVQRAVTDANGNDGGETFRNDMIQTDAAISPGNSGGPLLNSKGQVIGVNTMKAGGANVEGLGFAIPINMAIENAKTLITDGSIPQPVNPGIGFSYQPVTAEDAEMWGTPKGIIVREIVPGSPAQKAGLQLYDIITGIDGVDLTVDGAEVPLFDGRNVGDTVNATVWRDGQEMQITFELADLNALTAS